jgi:predicted metal-dependent phosphoesterase TrpH
VVGEEITTRGGHLLALFLERPIKPLRSLRETIARVHDQGGIAIPAHPLVPYPLCAQAGALRRLAADPDPRFRPDALETFNPTALGRPWHPKTVAFAAELGLAAVGNSDAHTLDAIGQGWSTFPGRTAGDLRNAILTRQTHWHGSFHGTRAQLSDFALQVRKYSRGWRQTIQGAVLRNGTGRDLGYPGGHLRPAVFDRQAAQGRVRPASRRAPEAEAEA